MHYFNEVSSVYLTYVKGNNMAGKIAHSEPTASRQEPQVVALVCATQGGVELG